MFLLVFFICGSVWGFLESYLFWFLEDLGSTKLTMGLSLAVGTIAGVPLTIGSAFIIGRLGYRNLLYDIVAVLTRRTMFLQAPFPHTPPPGPPCPGRHQSALDLDWGLRDSIQCPL